MPSQNYFVPEHHRSALRDSLQQFASKRFCSHKVPATDLKGSHQVPVCKISNHANLVPAGTDHCHLAHGPTHHAMSLAAWQYQPIITDYNSRPA
jgi:hypothetical protein